MDDLISGLFFIAALVLGIFLIVFGALAIFCVTVPAVAGWYMLRQIQRDLAGRYRLTWISGFTLVLAGMLALVLSLCFCELNGIRPQLALLPTIPLGLILVWMVIHVWGWIRYNSGEEGFGFRLKENLLTKYEGISVGVESLVNDAALRSAKMRMQRNEEQREFHKRAIETIYAQSFDPRPLFLASSRHHDEALRLSSADLGRQVRAMLREEGAKDINTSLKYHIFSEKLLERGVANMPDLLAKRESLHVRKEDVKMRGERFKIRIIPKDAFKITLD